MKTFLVILGCLVLAKAQDYRVRDSKNAKILQEARYLQGGNHGAAYLQDDGTEFKEETDADGTRKGSYSYIDDTGKKITVQYTAGKNGFMVSGDHLPKAPEPLPVAPQQPTYQSQPQNQYNPVPHYNAIPTPQANQFSYSSPAQRTQFPQQQQQFAASFDPYRNDIGANAFGGLAPANNFPGQFQQPQIPTQSPRHFAPGKLNLNRTPDGFQYSFSSS